MEVTPKTREGKNSIQGKPDKNKKKQKNQKFKAQRVQTQLLKYW